MFVSVLRLLCTLHPSLSVLRGAVVLFGRGSVFGLRSGVWRSLLLWGSGHRRSGVLRWGHLLCPAGLWDTGGLLPVFRLSGDLFGVLLHLFPDLNGILYRMISSAQRTVSVGYVLYCNLAFCIYSVWRMNLLHCWTILYEATFWGLKPEVCYSLFVKIHTNPCLNVNHCFVYWRNDQSFFITIEILFDTSDTEMTHFIFNSEEQKIWFTARALTH